MTRSRKKFGRTGVRSGVVGSPWDGGMVDFGVRSLHAGGPGAYDKIKPRVERRAGLESSALFLLFFRG